MAAPIEFEIRADTSDAVRQLRELEDQLDEVNGSTGRAADGAETMGEAVEGMGKLTEQSKTQVVGLVDGLGASIPVFGQAKAAAQGFGAAMGPLGVALGAITVIAPVVIQAFRDMGEAADDAAGRARNAASIFRSSMDDLRSFANEAMRTERAALRQELSDIEMQLFSLDEMSREAAVLRARRADIQAELLFTPEPGEGGATGGGGGRAEEPGRQSGRGGPDAKALAVQAEMDRAAQAIKDSMRALEEEIEAGVDNALDLALGLGDQQIVDRENAHKDHLARLAAARREFEAEQQAASEALAKQEAQFANDKAAAQREAAEIQRTTAVSAAETGIQAANMVAANFAETQGQMELFQGISDAAMAITKFAAYDYASGALYLVSSGLHFANAAQMGVGGGSNAAAGAAGSGPQDRSARPVAPGGGLGGGGGPTNYTVNINSPVTERDVGRMQRRAEQERSRRFDARV